MTRPAVALSPFVLAFGIALTGAAEDSPRLISSRPPSSAEAFGGQIQQRMIPVTEFVPEQSGYAYDTAFSARLRSTAAGTQNWFAPLDLPPGAAIEEIRVLVRDDDAAFDIEARLSFVARAIDGSDACDGSFYWGAWAESSAGISGHGTIVLQGDDPLVVRSQDFEPASFCTSENYLWYSVWIGLQSVDQSVSGVVVRWRRTVSPAPSSATFSDVPTDHPLFQFVEALAASGITAGCGSGNYCPNNPLTRGQMAVFLSIALGLHWPL